MSNNMYICITPEQMTELINGKIVNYYGKNGVYDIALHRSEKTYTKFVDNSSIPLRRFKDLDRGETFTRSSDLLMKTDDDTAVNLNYGYILHNIEPDDVVRPALTTITIEK